MVHGNLLWIGASSGKSLALSSSGFMTVFIQCDIGFRLCNYRLAG
jgi:hypothetical protein